MSYTTTISGHAESKKQEAAVLKAAADFADEVEAKGAFSFSGMHFHVQAGPTDDAVAKARELVDEHNATADADDKV